jgi:hypothetical protein
VISSRHLADLLWNGHEFGPHRDQSLGEWKKNILHQLVTMKLPSGKHTKNYGKSPFIVDFPMNNGDFP